MLAFGIPTARARARRDQEANIYVFGGFARSTTTITPLASVEVFDTVANRWSSRASLQSPRAWSGCGEINGQLYVVGGQAQSSLLLAGNDKYDPVADTWLSQTPMDDPNYVFAVTVASGEMFVFDGARIDRYEPVKE